MLGHLGDAAFRYAPPGRDAAQEGHDFFGFFRPAERDQDERLEAVHARTLATPWPPRPVRGQPGKPT